MVRSDQFLSALINTGTGPYSLHYHKGFSDATVDWKIFTETPKPHYTSLMPLHVEGAAPVRTKLILNAAPSTEALVERLQCMSEGRREEGT